MKRKIKKGFSLLELLIYIAVLSGLMVVISNAFISLSKGRGQAGARSEVNAAMRFAAERIKQDIKNASSTIPIVAPFLGETASSTLKVKSPDGLSVITYDALLGQLRRNDGGAYATTTGSNIFVDTPKFTRIENYSTALNATTTSIQVEMTFHYNASSTDWAYVDTLRTTVTLR